MAGVYLKTILLLLMAVLGSCGQSENQTKTPQVTAEVDAPVPSDSQGPKTTKEDIEEIQLKIDESIPITILATVKVDEYPEAIKKIKSFEKDGLLRIHLNPNTDEHEVDVAPFLVLQIDPKFFVGRKPTDVFSVLSLDSFSVDRMQSMPAVQPSDLSAVAAAQMPLGAMQARELGVLGEGMKVAVIDTGLDLSHPMFLQTPSGKPKVVDAIDFTPQGNIALEKVESPTDKCADFESLKKSALQIEPQLSTKKVEVACLYEKKRLSVLNLDFDLNTDGAESLVYPIVVFTDENSTRIAVDINKSGAFEKSEMVSGFTPGSDLKSSLIYFGSGRNFGVRSASLRVVEGINGKRFLNIFTDIHGHGSHVGGIIAGHGVGPNGAFQGVAPEAQLMGLKVCVEGCPSSAILQAIIYAAKNGAHVANLSLGGLESKNPNAVEPRLYRYLSQKYGTLFVISAGNEGPALNTTKDPGNGETVLTVGAYNPAESWDENYGLPGLPDSIFWWSSRGPKHNGGFKPNVVAPGGALSAVPQANNTLGMYNGTSMSAPMTAGLSALVLQKGLQENLKILQADVNGSLSQRPLVLKRALEEGAISLPGYHFFEQGYGKVNGPKSFEKIKEWEQIFENRLKLDSSARLFRYINIKGNGSYNLIDGSPGEDHSVQIEELPDFSLKKAGTSVNTLKGFDVECDAAWITLAAQSGVESGCKIQRLQPWGRRASFKLRLTQLEVPHEGIVKDTLVKIKDSETGVPLGALLVTNIDGETLNSKPQFYEDGEKYNFVKNFGNHVLAGGQLKRFYVRVPQGTASLGIDTRANADAQIAVIVKNPEKTLVEDVDNLNVSRSGVLRMKPNDQIIVPTEIPGLYEIVVVALTTLKESHFNLQVKASGLSNITPITLIEDKTMLSPWDALRNETGDYSLTADSWLGPVLLGSKEFDISLGGSLYLPLKEAKSFYISGVESIDKDEFAYGFVDKDGKLLEKGPKDDYDQDPDTGLYTFKNTTKGVKLVVFGSVLSKGFNRVSFVQWVPTDLRPGSQAQGENILLNAGSKPQSTIRVAGLNFFDNFVSDSQVSLRTMGIDQPIVDNVIPGLSKEIIEKHILDIGSKE